MEVIKIEEVTRLTSLSKSSIRRLEKSGAFPKSWKITEKRVGWLRSDIERWIQERTERDPAMICNPEETV